MQYMYIVACLYAGLAMGMHTIVCSCLDDIVSMRLAGNLQGDLRHDN